MRALTRFRFPLLALGLAFTLGCSADSPSSPTAPPSAPIPPAVGINVTVTSSTSALEAGSTEFATLTIRAFRADNGAPVANLTPGTITTTLGSLGSAGGPQTLSFELVNGQATVVLFPGATVGTASIRANVATGVGLTSVLIREPGVPDTFFISSVSPSTGSPQGGETVTINGGGFSDPIRVTIGGIPAVIQSASGSQIRVTTPRCGVATCFDTGQITPVAVSVTINLNEEGQLTDTLTPGFTYVNGGGGGILQPTIFSVTPSSGPNEGGTQVTINGDGFEAPVAVDFGEGNGGPFVSAQVLSVTRTRIVVLSPPATGIGQENLNELVDVRVANQNSGRFTIATSAFRYGVAIRITAISPTQGPPEGGTLVTIFGQGFDEPVAVSLAGHGQQVISVSGSEIVVRTVPIVISSCANAAGPAVVTNIESGDTASSGSTAFTYLVTRPTVTGASPASGPQAGNTLVTITGSGFGSPMVVEFVVRGSSFPGVVQSTTGSTISVRTPSIPSAVMDTQTCDDNGDPVPQDPPLPDPDGERFLNTSASIKVTDPDTGCTVTLNGSFLFIATDGTCRGD